MATRPDCDRRKVLIARHGFHPLALPELARLEANGLEVAWNRTGRRYGEDEIARALAGCFAVIATGEPYTERVLAAAPELRLIARWGVGQDSVDVPAATRLGVAVAMTFDANHESVADLVLTFMAGLACDLADSHERVVSGRWAGDFHGGLWRSTVGIVGLGRVGRAVARRCRGFEMEILANDIADEPAAHAARNGIAMVALETLLDRADFVSLSVPLTPKTEGLIDARRLKLMKPSAYLINTSRGRVVDEDALAEAIRVRRIAGAALDVFRDEPPVGSALLGLKGNLLLSPHWGAYTAEAQAATARMCVDAVLAVARGEAPAIGCVVNPEALATRGGRP